MKARNDFLQPPQVGHGQQYPPGLPNQPPGPQGGYYQQFPGPAGAPPNAIPPAPMAAGPHYGYPQYPPQVRSLYTLL